MIIKTSYLKTLIGKKVTLLKSNLSDFHRTNLVNPVGRVVNITNDGQLIVSWYTTHHNTYNIDIFEDEFEIYD